MQYRCFAVHFQTAAFSFFSLFSLIYQISWEGTQLETLAIVSSAKVFERCIETLLSQVAPVTTVSV